MTDAIRVLDLRTEELLLQLHKALLVTLFSVPNMESKELEDSCYRAVVVDIDLVDAVWNRQFA
jgi:type VI protein secretion system component VasF